MKNPLVSIITPTYNSQSFIVETIESVFAQTYANWELILVDDCSQDDTWKILEEYKNKDSRVKILKLDKNYGAGVARNKGITIAEGDFMAFVDSDDIWVPQKLELQLNFMKEKRRLICYSSYYLIDESSEKTGYIIHAPQEINFRKNLRNDYIGFLTFIYNCKEIGKIYMPEIRKRQDWALKLLVLKKGGIAYGIDQPLAYYRKGQQSLSKNKFKLFKYNFKVFNEVLEYSKIHSFFRMTYFLMHYFRYKSKAKKKE